MPEGARPRRPGFGKVVGRAFGRWTNLGVLGASAVAAAALGLWPILALGGAAYGALVAWDVASPDFWRKALGEAGPPSVTLPDPKKIKDLKLAAAVTKILAAREEVAAVLADTAPDVKAHLAGAVAQIAELERHAVSLVTSGEGLARYLAGAKTDGVRQELLELTRKARETRDAEARAQYESARAARDEQLKAIEDIANSYERIVAKLATVVAALEALPPKIVRMRALDAQQIDELSGNVNEELQRMNGEIRVFEETLKSLSEVT